jgi:hypothetical protein
LPDDCAKQIFGSLVTEGLCWQELLEKYKEASNKVSWPTLGSEKKIDTIYLKQSYLMEVIR